MTIALVYDSSVRVGYARVSTRTQDHLAQLDALASAHCREIIVETASTRCDRPKLREALGKLRPATRRAAGTGRRARAARAQNVNSCGLAG